MKNVDCPREFLPKQRLILETRCRFPFYSGAFGAGKTLLGCHKIIKECLENPRSVALCASQTYPQLRDTVVKTFFEELELLQQRFNDVGCNIVLVKSWNKTEYKLTLFNGSIVLFRSCEDYSKFKSLNLDFFFIDEPVDVSEEIFYMLQGRLRGRHTRHHFGVLCGNPTNQNSWIYDLFFKNPPSEDYYIVQTSSYDNIFLPDGYVESLEKAYDDDWTKRYLKGEWFNFEGLIYQELQRDVHVKDFSDTRYSYEEYLGGFDYGYRNPCCLLVLARDSDDNLIVLEELYRSGLTNSEIATKVKEIVEPYMNNFRSVLADPSMPAVIDEIDRFGIRCKPGDNDVVSGISVVKNHLKQRSLFIDKSCVNLIRELESYQYEKDTFGRDFSERPVKKDDHAVDALRYAAMGVKNCGGTTYFILG